MKRLLLLFLLLNTFFVDAQIITTIAGNGSDTYSGDGDSAISAGINYPYACAFDSKGDFYFSALSGDRIRKVTPCGTISTIAGIGTEGYNGDNIPATQAELYWPTGIAFDAADNMYIADAQNNRIRKIDAITGIISTFAGNGTQGFGGDGGPATSAMLYEPGNICFDRFGNLYIVDNGNERIREVNTSGIISTFAGIGIPGYTGDGGYADSAEIENLYGICTDTIGNIFFEQQVDNKVRKIDTAGIITTIAGNGSAQPSGDGDLAISAGLDPFGLAFDGFGNLYISGYLDNDIRKVNDSGIIYTVAGNGFGTGMPVGDGGFSGDGGPADSAELNDPHGITVDIYGNIYIADFYNNRIRKVAFNSSSLCSDAEVDNIAFLKASNIYPNPAYSSITVSSNNVLNGIAITNPLGQTVYRAQCNGSKKEQINIAALPSGIYFVKVNNYIQKIVKE